MKEKRKKRTCLFTPPHCPNPRCDNHAPPENNRRWYINHGAKIHTPKDKKLIEQFICKSCKKSFSESSFRLSYYEKVHIDYKEIIKHVKKDTTLTALTLSFETTPPTIKIRLRKLCWHLIEKLEKSENSANRQKRLSKLVDRFRSGERGYPLLRDLIVCLKPLFRQSEEYPRCFFGRNRKTSKSSNKAKERKSKLIALLWRIIETWYYPLTRSCFYTPVYLGGEPTCRSG